MPTSPPRGTDNDTLSGAAGHCGLSGNKRDLRPLHAAVAAHQRDPERLQTFEQRATYAVAAVLTTGIITHSDITRMLDHLGLARVP